MADDNPPEFENKTEALVWLVACLARVVCPAQPHGSNTLSVSENAVIAADKVLKAFRQRDPHHVEIVTYSDR